MPNPQGCGIVWRLEAENPIFQSEPDGWWLWQWVESGAFTAT